MPGYVIAQYTVNNPEPLTEYTAKVRPTIAAHQGRVLVADGDVDLREGALPGQRTVVLEFPSKKAAQGWYDSPEYQAILPLRVNNSTGCLTIVDGFVPPAS